MFIKLATPTFVLLATFLAGIIVLVQGQGSSTFPPLLPPDAVFDIPELGKIQGLKWFTSVTQQKFFAFHGIPYAKDTSGPGRFKPSVLREGPLAANGGVFNATDPLIMCPQGFFEKAKGTVDETNLNLLNLIKSGLFSWKWNRDVRDEGEEKKDIIPDARENEDCLVLNINTPSIPKVGEENPKYPVIFFIHGGSSTSVFGSPFTGFRFLEHKVILVTINYRLGVLGALNLGIDNAPGNAAMYDALTALNWVQKYIHHFGGDKDRVVVYGHSAGSMMATHLLLSPLAAGKFSGVIGASGSALACWGTAEENSISHHLEVAFHAGCYPEWETAPTADPNYEEIYKCMEAKDESILRKAFEKYSDIKQSEGGIGLDAVVPSLQNSPGIKTTPKFLSEMPHDIIKQGKQNKVNLIMGATRHDGSFAFDGIYETYVNVNGRKEDPKFLKNELIPQLLKTLNKVPDKSGAFAHILEKTYFGDGMKNGIFNEMLPGLIDLTSIWGFKAPAFELVQKHAAVNPRSFYYAFDFAGFWSTCDLSGTSDIPCGIPHVDDMSFTFQIFPLLNEDLEVSNRMVKYFVNFATYGSPNSPTEDDNLIFWPPYNPMTHEFLKIGAEDKIEDQCRDKWIGNGLEIVEP